MQTRRPDRKFTQNRLRNILAASVALTVGWTTFAYGAPAVAASEGVQYAVPNADFAQPLAGTWATDGGATQEHSLELTTSGVAYQGIPITSEETGPAVGDVLSAQVDVTLHADVTGDSTVLARITDGSSVLAEWSDLTSLPRGQRVTVNTQFVGNGGQVGPSAETVWIELHNDVPGTIEFHDIRVTALRGGAQVPYLVPNADFRLPLNPATNWSSSNARIASSVVLEAGATISQALAVGDDASLPQLGDSIALVLDAFVDPRAPRGSEDFATASAGGLSLHARDSDELTRATWQELSATGADGSVIGAGVEEVNVELRNPTAFPLRLRDVQLSGTRTTGNDDLNGDGTVDAADAAWFANAVSAGVDTAALDYDRDGQVTTKDISFFVRFVLGDTSEVYANLAHLDFLSEHVELDGIPMMIVHLYAEPLDRSDLSQGYEWVGDPQEGVSALDDVARAVVVYAEHFATHRDAHSYDQMKRGIEFAMWMQAPNGDFDNFVARDSNGDLFKKDSASSQTIFGYWAARAYEAMATALPLLSDTDAELAERVEARMKLCLDRISELVSPEYGQTDATGAPKWLLQDDSWLSSVAVSALVRHAEIVEGADRTTAITRIRELAEGIAHYQAGDFDDYPLGAIKHNSGNWYEWGSIQVKALALAGSVTGVEEFIDAAKLSADSYLSDLLISGRSMEVSPNKTGLPQINYGTASYVDNYLTLYAVTGDRKYAVMAGVAATWWMGNNPINQPMFDQALGLAFDGITIAGLNSNSGAESVDEALRAILRVQRVPEALAVMTSKKLDQRTATTIEIEDLLRAGRPDDTQLSLPGGGLDDPAKAIATQEASSGVDELAVYEDSLAVSAEQTIYENWTGRNALFVTGSGYNNVRVFDDGHIETGIPIGGAGDAQPGDALMLDFSALLQFQTDLDAEVIAVDAAGGETVLADDSAFRYNPRTWYSGAGSVRTTLLATVPADADHLEVRFSNQSTNAKAHEGYATVTSASLYRLGVPEVRYGSSAFSNRAYAHLDADSSADLVMDVPTTGDHNVFLSAVDSAETSPSVAIHSPTGFDFETQLSGADGSVSIRHLGRAGLAAGPVPLTVTTGAEAADVDALIVYPVETFATFELRDGSQIMILRDADSRELLAGSPDELQNRAKAPVAITDPVIDGRADLGERLTASAGEWRGEGITHTYQWLRDGEPIRGATDASYRVSRADQGTGLSVRVTAANPAGTTDATSAEIVARYSTRTVVVAKPTIVAKAGTNISLSVRVLSTPAVSSGSISISVAGKTATGTIENGSATIDVGVLPRGVHRISAHYEGNDEASPSTGVGLVIVLR